MPFLGRTRQLHWTVWVLFALTLISGVIAITIINILVWPLGARLVSASVFIASAFGAVALDRYHRNHAH